MYGTVGRVRSVVACKGPLCAMGARYGGNGRARNFSFKMRPNVVERQGWRSFPRPSRNSSSTAGPRSNNGKTWLALVFGGAATLALIYSSDFIHVSPHRCESSALNPRRAVTSKFQRFEPAPPLSSERINGILYADASEYYHPTGQGVARSDLVRLPSNDPTEDTYVREELRSDNPRLRWIAWGVYDGHCGPQVSHVLAHTLTSYVKEALSNLYLLESGSSPTNFAIDKIIKRAFVSLDEDILSPAASILKSGAASFAEKVNTLVPGYAGSCALLCLYDSESSELRVACTGDSRAVLATRTSDGGWAAQDLSTAQNGENPSEKARLEAAHPDEPEMIKGIRVLGLAISRAFGDSPWKWDRATQEEARRAYGGPRLRPPLKTPPYLTAEPEVTTTQIDRTKPTFMIVASDGLWDTMSSQQAVDMVAKWLNWNAQGRPAEEPPKKTFTPFDFSYEDGAQYRWEIPDEWSTTKDSNAAVHLVRNALGGKNEDFLGAVLAINHPWSRDIRDDITVQVVFFGDGWGDSLPAKSPSISLKS